MDILRDVEFLVRKASLEKPSVKAIEARGVAIRITDIGGPIDELVDQLKGADILICAIDATSLLTQINLATAAQKAGVRWFIPCNFGTIVPGELTPGSIVSKSYS
ncbi:Isoflavone reductase family protein [Penicillium expansum]|nr:Isoflavone reductase family protein [Penicillium expansum]